jgi:hypothetical protein
MVWNIADGAQVAEVRRVDVDTIRCAFLETGVVWMDIGDGLRRVLPKRSVTAGIASASACTKSSEQSQYDGLNNPAFTSQIPTQVQSYALVGQSPSLRTGAHLVDSIQTASHDYAQPLGATVLDDGSLLCWAGENQAETTTFLQEFTSEGIAASALIPIDEAPWLYHSLFFEYMRATHSFLIRDNATAWYCGNVVGVSARTGWAATTCWQTGSRVFAHALTREGVVVATTRGGDVVCLQLLSGNRRMTIDEYEHTERK